MHHGRPRLWWCISVSFATVHRGGCPPCGATLAGGAAPADRPTAAPAMAAGRTNCAVPRRRRRRSAGAAMWAAGGGGVPSGRPQITGDRWQFGGIAARRRPAISSSRAGPSRAGRPAGQAGPSVAGRETSSGNAPEWGITEPSRAEPSRAGLGWAESRVALLGSGSPCRGQRRSRVRAGDGQTCWGPREPLGSS